MQKNRDIFVQSGVFCQCFWVHPVILWLIAKAKIWMPLKKNEAGAALYLPMCVTKKIHRRRGVWYPKIAGQMLHLYLCQASKTARARAAFTCAGLQPLLHEGIQDSNSDTCVCAELHWNHLYWNHLYCSLQTHKLPARKLYIPDAKTLIFFRTEYLHRHWELTGLLFKIICKKINLFSK